MKNSGFTLIELLVVISIISLLSSVVISSMVSSRVKADNARAFLTVREYYKALELYRSSYNYYPIADALPTNTYCIPSGVTCLNSSPSNTSLNTKVKENIGDLSKINGINVPFGAAAINGLEYACQSIDSSGQGCATLYIRWFLNGSVSCGKISPTTTTIPMGNVTFCQALLP